MGRVVLGQCTRLVSNWVWWNGYTHRAVDSDHEGSIPSAQTIGESMKDCVWSKVHVCRWNHLCRVVPHCFGKLDKFNVPPSGEIDGRSYTYLSVL